MCPFPYHSRYESRGEKLKFKDIMIISNFRQNQKISKERYIKTTMVSFIEENQCRIDDWGILKVQKSFQFKIEILEHEINLIFRGFISFKSKSLT